MPDRILSQLFEDALLTKSVAQRIFLRAKIESRLRAAEPGTAAPEWLGYAAKLGLDSALLRSAQGQLPPNCVWVPLVSSDEPRVASAKAFFVTSRAHSPITIGGDADSSLSMAFQCAAEFLFENAPQKAALATSRSNSETALSWVPVNGGGYHIDGHSLGGAALLSAMAYLKRGHVNPMTCVSATLSKSGRGWHFGPVESLGHKIQCALDRGLRHFVVAQEQKEEALALTLSNGGPESGFLEVHGISTTAELYAFITHQKATSTELTQNIRREMSSPWSGFRWPTIATQIAYAKTEAKTVTVKVELLGYEAAALRHLGRFSEGAAMIREALNLCGSPKGRLSVPEELIGIIERQAALTLARQGHLGAALRQAEQSVRRFRESKHLDEAVKSLGAMGWIAFLKDDLNLSCDAHSRALQLSTEFAPELALRTAGYLCEVEARLGKYAVAQRRFEKTIAQARGEDAAWIRVRYAGGLLWRKHWLTVREVLSVETALSFSHGAIPGLMISRYLGLAETQSKTHCETGLYRLLSAEPFTHEHNEPMIRAVAGVNLLAASWIGEAKGLPVSVDTDQIIALLQQLVFDPALLSQLGNLNGGTQSRASVLQTLLRLFVY